MARKTIVILGGYGVFGRHIADQLAKDGAARVVVAGRDVNKGQACAETIGAEFARCDARDRDSLRGVLSGADLVVNAAGPFQDSEYPAAEACIDQRCHYIDIGDGRNYVSGMSGLFKTLGTWHGGLAVWATGDDGLERSIALVARRKGPRVASAAAVLLARKIIAGRAPDPGAYPCVGFLSMAELAGYLAPFDISVAHGRGAHW